MGQTIPDVGGQTKLSWGTVQDLLESLCEEFNLFRKGKVCAVWEVLGERSFVLDKNSVISERNKEV